MPEFHAEPYVYLGGLTHKSALIAWGGFYFRVKKKKGEFKLVDDSDLDHVHPPRKETIGERSEPYGKALVEVRDSQGALVASAETETANHCWVTDLEPNTEYSYRVVVNGEEWGGGDRRDWVAEDDVRGLKPVGGRYVNRFRTFPHPQKPFTGPVNFAVMGDFGVGVKKPSNEKRRQREIAKSLERAVATHDLRFLLTTGDNIYAQKKFLGIPAGGTGDEDDDWFFTFYQPYRYVINRIPVFPSIGNHDSQESEVTDDRIQLADNLYLKERLAGEEKAGRASVGPGLFYKFRFGANIEFVCIDTSREPQQFFLKRLFELPHHRQFLESAFPQDGDRQSSPAWRLPFSHHPRFSAGPRHHNSESMEQLVPLFQRGGVRAAFSGHEHNFQHSAHAGIDYFITGAAGKLRRRKPDQMGRAHTVSWSAQCHFLLVTIEDRRMTVRPVGELTETGEPLELERLTPDGKRVTGPITVSLDRLD